MKKILTIASIIIVLLVSGCFSSQNKKANELYVSASEYVRGMKAESESHAKVFQLYKKAKNDVDLIVSDYSATNLAASLVSGSTLISGYKYDDFMGLDKKLKQLVKIEQDPFSPMLDPLIGGTIDNEAKLQIFWQMAVAYSEGGNTNKSSQLFEIMFEQIAMMEEKEEKKYYFILVSIEYAKHIKNKKAIKLLGQSEEIAKTLEKYPVFKVNNILTEFAAGYAHNGVHGKVEDLLLRSYKTSMLTDRSPTYELRRIAEVYSGIGENEKASKILEQVAELYHEDDFFMGSNTLELIIEYSKIGNNKKAIQIIADAYEAEKIMTLGALVDYAKMYAHIGYESKAREILFQAEKKLENDKYKSRFLSYLADGYASIGDDYASTKLLEEALEIAKNNHVDSDISSISIAQAKSGQFAKAIDTAN